MPEEKRRGDEVPLPQPAGFTKKSRQPLQPQSYPETTGAPDGTCVKIKDGADTADERCIQSVPVLMHPFLLFWGRHADEKHIGGEAVYSIDNCCSLFFAEFFPVRRTKGSCFQRRMLFGKPLPDLNKGRFRRSQVEA